MNSPDARDCYLTALGVSHPSPSTVAFDPGYDPLTLGSHLDQSAHLLCGVKISMATWQISSCKTLNTKIDAIRRAGVPAISGGGPFEVAAYFGLIPAYLDLCRKVGFTRVEVGEGFSSVASEPEPIIQLATDRRLTVQFEIGRKFGGAYRSEEIDEVRKTIRKWLEAGTEQIVVEAREDAIDVGLFDAAGNLNQGFADMLVKAVGNDLRRIQFEAPTKKSQFALIEHFGRDVILANVRLEEILRIETFRRGLHPRSFLIEGLRPSGPAP